MLVPGLGNPAPAAPPAVGALRGEAGPRRQPGLLLPSKTVPVREVNLAPHERHLHPRRPDGSRSSLQGDEPHLGHVGSGLKSSATSANVPKPSTSRQARSSSAAERSARPSASRDATRAEWGLSLFISVCPIRPDARPAGSSSNDEPGRRLGKFISLAGTW